MAQARKKLSTRGAAPRRPPASPRQAARWRRPIDERLDPRLFRALSDPTRLTLLACVAKCSRPCSVGEVALCCRVDLSTVSRHLATLARAGVMESSKEGTTVRYAVRYEHVATALRGLADALDQCRPRPGATAAGCCDGDC
jgi:ArsR family transcriptional regulator